jgi:hypothetical protein
VVLSGGGKVSLTEHRQSHFLRRQRRHVEQRQQYDRLRRHHRRGGVGQHGTINAHTVSMLFLNASTINAGKLEATASGGTLLLASANISNTSTGTILASGSGAHVFLNGAVISGGRLQTQAGGEIDVNNGVLSGATIASARSLTSPTAAGSRFLAGSQRRVCSR